jgi:hypothetical protein
VRFGMQKYVDRLVGAVPAFVKHHRHIRQLERPSPGGLSHLTFTQHTGPPQPQGTPLRRSSPPQLFLPAGHAAPPPLPAAGRAVPLTSHTQLRPGPLRRYARRVVLLLATAFSMTVAAVRPGAKSPSLMTVIAQGPSRARRLGHARSYSH